MTVTAISLFLISNASALQIHEIMYHPSENDNYNEWVELFNDADEDVDLRNFSLCGKMLLAGYIDRDGIVHNDDALILSSGAYAIITDGGSGTDAYETFDIDQDALSIHVDGSSLCGGLSNSGDELTIEDEKGELIESVTYTDDAAEGYSLELFEDAFFESQNAGGTPGYENSEHSQDNDADETDDNDESDETEPVDEDEPDTEEDTEDESKQEKDSTETLQAEQNDLNFTTLIATQKPRDTIVLQPPEETELTEKKTTFVSKQQKLRIGVLFSFSAFMILLLVLLFLRKI